MTPDFAPLHLRGECDQCHAPLVVLFAFEDDEPGDWTYCEPCAVKLARRRRERARKARAV